MKHKRSRCNDEASHADGVGRVGLAADHHAGMAGDDQDTIDTPLHGQGLLQLLKAANDDCTQGLPVGTRVWAKMRGYCAWPGTTWSLAQVPKGDWPDLLRSYKPGYKLVKFYGEHSLTWVTPTAMTKCAPLPASLVSCLNPDSIQPTTEQQTLTKPGMPLLEESGAAAQEGMPQRVSLLAGTDNQANDASGSALDTNAAVDEPDEAEAQVSKPQSEPEQDLHILHQQKLTALREWGRKMDRIKLTSATIWEMEGCLGEGAAEVCRVMRLSEVWGNQAAYAGNYLLICGCCGENRAEVVCKVCSRAAHALCLNPPSLDRASMPLDQTWRCPKCMTDNITEAIPIIPVVPRKRGRKKRVPEGGTAAATSSTHAQQPDAADADIAQADKERLGLTPDWIIHTVIYHIFGLQRPTPEVPYIAGLLDPATNSKLAPNIPAEKLYDANDNGLDRSNAWAGYWILLNPDYRSQTQWRFVNRAIDEVESGKVPAILLLCRNSTDSAYFQRLRPYPRVLLRRNSAHFKDYNRTTPGFGIAACLLATPEKTDLYLRFLSGFNHSGEASIPIDATFMRSAAFMDLCQRLRLQALHQQRDHWVQCGNCGKWRILPYHAVLDLKEDVTWTCAMLRPPHSNCRTALTRTELLGIHHGTIADDDVLGLPVWQPSARSKALGKAQASQVTATVVAAALPAADITTPAKQPSMTINEDTQPPCPELQQPVAALGDTLQHSPTLPGLPALVDLVPTNTDDIVPNALFDSDIVMQEVSCATPATPAPDQCILPTDVSHHGIGLEVQLEGIAFVTKQETDVILAGIIPLEHEKAGDKCNDVSDASPAFGSGLGQQDIDMVPQQQRLLDASLLSPNNDTAATSQRLDVAVDNMLLDVKQQHEESVDTLMIEPASPVTPGTARKSGRQRKPTAKAVESAKPAARNAAAKEPMLELPKLDKGLPPAAATAVATDLKPVVNEVVQQAIQDLTSIWQSMQGGGVLKGLTVPSHTGTPAVADEQQGKELEDLVEMPQVLQTASKSALPEMEPIARSPCKPTAASTVKAHHKQPATAKRKFVSGLKPKALKSSIVRKNNKPVALASSSLKLHVSTAIKAASTALTRTREVKAPRRLDPGAHGLSARALNALRRKQGLLNSAALPARRPTGQGQPVIARLTQMLQNAKAPVPGQATVEIGPRLPRKRPAQTNQSTATATLRPDLAPETGDASIASINPSKVAVGSQVIKATISTAASTGQKPWGNPSVPLIGRKARGHASVAAILASRGACKGIKHVKAGGVSTQKQLAVVDPLSSNAAELRTTLIGCNKLMDTLQTWFESAVTVNATQPCLHHAASESAAVISQRKPVDEEGHIRDSDSILEDLDTDMKVHDDVQAVSKPPPQQQDDSCLHAADDDHLVLLSPRLTHPVLEGYVGMPSIEAPALAIATEETAVGLDSKAVVASNRPANNPTVVPSCSVLVKSVRQLHAQLETVAHLLQSLNLS